MALPREVLLSDYTAEVLARPIGVIVDNTSEVRDPFYRSSDVVGTVDRLAASVPESLREPLVDQVIRLFKVPPRIDLRTSRSCVRFVSLAAWYRVNGFIDKAERLERQLQDGSFIAKDQEEVSLDHTVNSAPVVHVAQAQAPRIEILEPTRIHSALIQQAKLGRTSPFDNTGVRLEEFRTFSELPEPFTSEVTYGQTKKVIVGETEFFSYRLQSSWGLSGSTIYPKSLVERLRENLVLTADPRNKDQVSNIYTIDGKLAFRLQSPRQAIEICFGYPDRPKLDEIRRLRKSSGINNHGETGRNEIRLSSPASRRVDGVEIVEWLSLDESPQSKRDLDKTLKDFARLQETIFRELFPGGGFVITWKTVSPTGAGIRENRTRD